MDGRPSVEERGTPELAKRSFRAERRFYEPEADSNQWSVRELQRQIASSLYQRVALSRDKDEVRRLAVEGQVVEKAADLLKNPIMLEFLGLEEHPHYSEEELKPRLELITQEMEGGQS